METQNKLSIAYWTSWEKKEATPHDRRRILNILLTGLAMIVGAEVLAIEIMILERIEELLLDTISSDYFWVLISMLPNEKRFTICAAVLAYYYFI